MQILFVASEAIPFIKTGGLADVIGTLPKELNKHNLDVRIMIPYYRKIKDQFHFETQKSFLIDINGKSQYCGICSTRINNVTYYFIDNNYFFYREGSLYGHFDDGERFAYFDLAVLESLKALDYYPDIIHLHDWHTGMIPKLLKDLYIKDLKYQKIKTLFTIHNIEHQGRFPKDLSPYLNLNFDSEMEFNQQINFMKTAIITANNLSTVSKTYAEEIKTPFFGFGLDEIFNRLNMKIDGIINGIDYTFFNPIIDKDIYQNYDEKNLTTKNKNKTLLKQEFNFPKRKAPLVGMVSRFADQKGIDLIRGCIEEVIQKTDAMFIFMGTGDYYYESYFNDLTKRFPYNVKVYIGYHEKIAQKIYAAVDMFLMPSKYEPCGLSQLIAMRYGAIPIVRETGGLKDTVIPYNKYTKEGFGFTFANYDRFELMNCLIDAINLYQTDKKTWNTLVKKAMKLDYSWVVSAKMYLNLYQEIYKED